MTDLPAGRDLDELVAVTVMGYTRQEFTVGITRTVLFRDATGAESTLVPSYSKHIAYAWEVVERMRELPRWIDVRAGGLGYSCRTGPVGNETAGVVCANADTAPLAICRAALAALGAK